MQQGPSLQPLSPAPVSGAPRWRKVKEAESRPTTLIPWCQTGKGHGQDGDAWSYQQKNTGHRQVRVYHLCCGLGAVRESLAREVVAVVSS